MGETDLEEVESKVDPVATVPPAQQEQEQGEGEEEEEDDGKKGSDKGYTCNVCFEKFLCCAAILAHKRKSGHGSFKCTSCCVYLPSISARKAHVAKTGHDSFEGTLFRVKDCRGLKKPSKTKEALYAESIDHFVSFTKYRKHESEFVIPLDEAPAPTFFEPASEEPSFQEETIIKVKANIREPAPPAFSFIPLNPFGSYNPMDPYWVPVEETPEVVEPEEQKVVVDHLPKPVASAPAVVTAKPVKKEPVAASKKALRAARKGRSEAGYTPFGKATAESDDKPFDLQFSFSYEAAMEHNIQLPELLIEDGIEEFPPPSDWLLKHMRREWSGAHVEHWDYVNSPVPSDPEEREIAEGDLRDDGNENCTLSDFLVRDQAKEAGLHLAEIVALRLYTGPGYKAINASTRNGDHSFCVTCFTLEAAIIKVAKNTKKANLVRGLSGRMSDRFQALYAEGRPLKTGDVIADPGFLSTTRNLDVVTSGNYKGSTLFVITGKSVRPGLLRMGADVAWISQFPREQEVLFPQFTELWYATKDKRDPKLDQKFGHLKKTQVYQFGARAKFNEDHSCPNIPGLTQ